MTPRPLRSILSCAMLLVALAIPAAAHAGGTFHQQMAAILAQYEIAEGALVADRFDGTVTKAAQQIASEARKLDTSTLPDAGREHFGMLPHQLETAATALSKATDLDSARKALGELGAPMSMWASMAKPSGITVMYCPMAKASWLQRGEAVANPYFGPEMRSCGQVGLPPAEDGMQGMDHGGMEGMDHGGMHDKESSSKGGHHHE